MIGDGSFLYKKFLTYADIVPRDKTKIQKYIKELSKENADIDECYKYILLQAASFGGKQIWKEITNGKIRHLEIIGNQQLQVKGEVLLIQCNL